MSNSKDIIIHLIAGLTKGCYTRISQCFPKPYEPFAGDITVKIELPNYATRKDLKNGTGIDASKLALKCEQVSSKAEVDRLDVDKRVPAPVDLSKISHLVRNNVVKKPVYDKLVAKVNNIDISGFVLKLDMTQTNSFRKENQ